MKIRPTNLISRIEQLEFKADSNIQARQTIWIFISVLTFCVIMLLIYTPTKMCNSETTTELLKLNENTIKHVEYKNTEVLCEYGVDVKEYKSLNQKWIYACLTLKNGKCSGANKTCIIKYTTKVCKIE